MLTLEDRSAKKDIFQSVFDTVTELMAGAEAEKPVLGNANVASNGQRQAKEQAGLVCKTPRGIDAFIEFCSQQASDLLAPDVLLLMSLQIVLRMRRDMSGEDLDQAATRALNRKLSHGHDQTRGHRKASPVYPPTADHLRLAGLLR